MVKMMNVRVIQTGVALVMITLSGSALAGTVWAPTADSLRRHMRTSQAVVTGRLTDVQVEERYEVVVARITDVQIEQRLATVRSGSGRITVEQLVFGIHALPTISWSDRTEITCPSLRFDQFKGRLGVWFVHVDRWGAFDSWASAFWDFDVVNRLLYEIEQSERLSTDLQRLKRAIELSSQAPATPTTQR
jgi:hypothetical protein